MTKAFDQHEEGTESPSSGSLHDDPINMEEGTFGSEINISATATPRRPQGLQRQNGARNITKTKAYSWKKFLRAKTLSDVFHWLINGFSPDVKQSEEEMLEDLNNTALLLTLLREYYNRFGMPDEGGPKDQEFVLREVTKDLYSSGCPIWALENVMQQCSEGLTGNQGVDFFVLPRKVGTPCTRNVTIPVIHSVQNLTTNNFSQLVSTNYFSGLYLCPIVRCHCHVQTSSWMEHEATQCHGKACCSTG